MAGFLFYLAGPEGGIGARITRGNMQRACLALLWQTGKNGPYTKTPEFHYYRTLSLRAKSNVAAPL